MNRASDMILSLYNYNLLTYDLLMQQNVIIYTELEANVLDGM